MPDAERLFTDTAGDLWRFHGSEAAFQHTRPLIDRAALTPVSTHEGNEPTAHVLLCVPSPAEDTPADYVNRLRQLHRQLPRGAVVRHPAALVGLTGIPAGQRWAVTGYPGAGNMVLQGVLQKIDTLRPEPPADPQTREAFELGQHHKAVVNEVVSRLLHTIRRRGSRQLEDFVIGPGHLGQCSIRATFADQTVLLMNHLPYAGFIGHDYGAHARWTREAAAFYRRFGYRRVYHAVRDPLAVLCSNAAKTVRPLEHALHDPAWFEPTAKQLAAYFDAAQAVLDKTPDAFKLVRYEDLTGHPHETIQKLGRDAGLDLTNAQADDIWDQVGFKSLTPAGDEHLFNPTADKRPHYRAAHLGMMEHAGLTPWFDRLGYTTPTAGDLPDGPLAPTPTPDKVPSALYGRIDPRAMHECRDPDLPLWIRSNDPKLPHRVAQTLRSSYLGRVMTSLGDAYGRLTPQPASTPELPKWRAAIRSIRSLVTAR